MKQIKHILSFLLLLILELSFTNSFASVCLSKDNVVSRIDFSETAKSNPDFSKTDSKENHIFEPSFHDIVSCPSVSCCVGYSELVEGWEVLHKSGVGDAVRKNITKLNELNGLLKKNNLGWQKADFENFLTRPTDKPWDNVDEVITALKRTSDANIDGVTLSYKKFPQPKDGSYSYVLDQAKKYQGGPGYDNAGNIVKGSGDANLSFDYNGVSFDNLTTDGTFIDRKFGQGNSIFDKVASDFGEFDIVVKNDSRINSLLDQAKRQINAAGGKPIRWEISTELGADGIKQVFSNPAFTNRFPGVDFSKIDVVWIKM